METNIRSPEPINNHHTITSTRSKTAKSFLKRRSSDTKMRFAIYMFCSLLLFGNYYCWNMPAAFESGIEHHFNITAEKY